MTPFPPYDPSMATASSKASAGLTSVPFALPYYYSGADPLVWWNPMMSGLFGNPWLWWFMSTWGWMWANPMIYLYAPSYP